MTGIEQLRKLGADAVRGGEVGRAICDIADQIERETEEQSARLYDERVGEETGVCELFGVEPVDDPLTSLRRHVESLNDTIENLRLELGEARDDAAWVREHGGLDHVKAEWSSRVPRDLYERRRRRLLGHIAECEAALGRRRRRIEELGHHVSDLTTENAELRRRVMPEGCEWPRYEDGEPVRIGDVVSDVEVRSVVFRDGGILLSDCTSVPGWGTWRSYKEPIRRPSVLAADGEPLEVGQIVWDADGMEFRVESFDSNGVWGSWKTDDGWIRAHPCPTLFTHQRPVLDADGVPIKEGDTVYWLEHTAPFTVVSPHETRDNDGQELKCGHTVEVMRDGHEPHMYVHPESLHHTKPEPPESWERIEDDATLSPEVYCHRNGIDISQKDGTEIFLADTVEPMARDLVRRAKALAERERGE